MLTTSSKRCPHEQRYYWATDVTKTFMISGGFPGKRPLHAVNGVDLTVNQGDVVALVGESGCGKTTLARMIPPESLTSGSVEADSKPLAGQNRLDVANCYNQSSRIPIRPEPRKSIGSIITLPLKVQGDQNPDTRRRRAEEMMELVACRAACSRTTRASFRVVNVSVSLSPGSDKPNAW